MKQLLAIILVIIMALMTYQAPSSEENKPEPTIETSTPESTDAPIEVDARDIAVLTMQYINELRNSEGACTTTEMPGCTEYAEYRSRQMAEREKVEHNYEDIRAAANAMQYGKYVDPSVYGLPGDPYYQVCGSEAVGNAVGDTVEEVARCLADGVYASKSHWRYVGSDASAYMSIGVSYNNGYWYCCIIASTVDLDVHPDGTNN